MLSHVHCIDVIIYEINLFRTKLLPFWCAIHAGKIENGCVYIILVYTIYKLTIGSFINIIHRATHLCFHDVTHTENVIYVIWQV